MKRIAAGMLLLALAGCTVGPRYQRPAIDAPPAFRNNFPDQIPTAASLGDEKWWQVFHDEELQKLIRQAIEKNYDVRIAANRVLQAQAQLGITRADQFPQVSGSFGPVTQRYPGLDFTVSYVQLIASFSWNVDFWGQYRSATAAARANLLSYDWNRQQVIASIVSSVAVAYLQLRELDLELDISKRALVSRRESLDLTETLANGGAAGLIDVRQAEQLVETAAGAIPDLERQIAQQEDLLSTLIGDNPHEIGRGKELKEETIPLSIPAGLPSRLLERRPDIRATEYQLIAANAEIGVARAQLFPSLPLTGSGGFANSVFLQLLSGGAGIWTASAPLTQPIFTAGKLRSNVRLTEAEQQQAVLTYRQTIQKAFQQVSDSLIAVEKFREYREHQEALTAAAQDAARLADMRYRGGATSYLEVLTSNTDYFAAQLNLARANLGERLAFVQTYIALGGGWEQ